jgi:hypothetical protein
VPSELSAYDFKRERGYSVSLVLRRAAVEAHNLVNAKDRANVDTSINVGASVQGVEANGITTALSLVDNNGVVVFLWTVTSVGLVL